jgi:hypothetical protein
MNQNINRRKFMICAALAPALASVAAEGGNQSPISPSANIMPAPKGGMPMGKIGQVELSRLMLGGNLVAGYAHSRDLSYVAELMKRYNTESRILQTLELAETHGINAINLSIWDNISFLQKHWQNGGKMKLIAQALPSADLDQFKRAVDIGACAVHLQGHGAEKLMVAGDMDRIATIMAYLKKQKVLAGVAAHSLEVIKRCEEIKLDCDFYQKTLHTHNYPTAPKPDETGYLGRYDNSWCKDPGEVVRVMDGVTKPWIAFKVMAAGAISPKHAFPYAYNNGADFILAGMFDWQIAEDVAVAKAAFEDANIQRNRPWMG